MGFGCNAAGVVGCRIIDSPRERLLAILTNNFVPCNGRFPTIISIISMFFIGSVAGGFSTFLSAVVLTAVILLGVAATFFVTKFLSTTLLKGVPSSFILEMPSFRRPQISKVIVRSIFDRTVFVLGRAVAVAAPAGVLIWLMANINIGEQSALRYFAEFLDPFAKLMGIDGIILIAFILGFPANEIVVPIMLMAYLSEGSLLQINDISVLKQVLVDNGWTIKTAVSVVLFSLMHWPCSTTLITIKKETGSIKWTLLSVLIPTIIGICVCMLFYAIASIFV
jgi:ferrous iron transport protein B